MIGPLESIDIRVGTAEDREAIAEFALTLSEDPISSRSKWDELIAAENSYPLVAVFKQNIVGTILAKEIGNIGWLEAAKVSPDFRQKGIANTLIDTALDWLITTGVDKIRTMVDSDNLAARRIFGKHHFSPQFLAINPTSRIDNENNDPDYTSEFARVLDEGLYETFKSFLDQRLSGNIMIDGLYLPFTQERFNRLIEEDRIYTNYDQSILLTLSDHNLPSEIHGLILTKDSTNYKIGAQALKAFTNRELASIAVAHAPANREAMIGLAKAEYGWGQPYSLMIYERGSWQQK